MPAFPRNPEMPPTGNPATESQALRAQETPVRTPREVPGRRCPGQRRAEAAKEMGLQGTASREALTLLTPSL